MRETFVSVPREVWEQLEYEVLKNNLDCDDNYRAFRIQGHTHFGGYVSARRNGCCGEYISSTVVNGDIWVMACNYGH
jgi:hypothetical protein